MQATNDTFVGVSTEEWDTEAGIGVANSLPVLNIANLDLVW